MAINVELQVFDGPLDLLLHLIEKNKVNIFDIPIVEITEQYLDYVRQLPSEDLGVMSEFMVMAAELISIKCRMLLPPEVDEEGEEIDPREELVQQLLEYKVYKYMSYELRERMADASRAFYKKNTTPSSVLRYKPEVDPAELIGETTLKKLHDIFSQVMKRQADKIDPVRSKFGAIEKEEVHLRDRLEHIFKCAVKKKRVSFRELLESGSGRMTVIVTFLGVLEMIKGGVLTVSQEEIDGDIIIERVPGADLSLIELDEGSYEGETTETEGAAV